jgi:polyketide synthase PksN
MISYSQKVQALRANAAAAPAVAPDECQQKVVALLAATLGVPRDTIQAATPFVEMGLSSLLGVRFLDTVNRTFGLKLGVETLFAHSTAAALAAHVASLAPRPAAPVLRAVETVPAAEAAVGDIAIIGMAGRFAGARDIDAFWQALGEGRSLVREVPPERWSAAEFYDPGADAAAKGKSISKWAGFLDDIDWFDAGFFNISPREAAAMDPQHRLFLEQAWLAFENAGYSADKLKGSATGVYVGASGSGYEALLDPAAKATQAYGLTGNLVSMLASRIAYFLDLRGPSLVVDTACSASLVALDLACQALQRGEIGMALVGGVCLFLDEKPFVAMTRTGMLSPDGRCHTFDASANGIAVGEAVAAVVLKPLARALADGDRIDAVIKATGTNQDGRSNGITAPNPEAQTALVRAVHSRAGIDPASITYVEAHGTGTPLGDPVEVAALRDALGARAQGDVPCAIGAVKSNIGHAAEAAGVAGLIKTVLCLKHAELVPSVNFSTLNPAIVPGDSGLQVVTRRQPWQPARGRKRRAGLSSFGLSGTNAHVVLEEAPVVAASPASTGPQLLLLSARDDAALARSMAVLATWLRGPGVGANLADLAATLALGRTHFNHRAAVIAATAAEAAALLSSPGPRVSCVLMSAQDARGLQETGLQALAEAYIAGAAPGGLPTAWRSLSLPGYPFAGAVHWAARRPAIPAPHPFAESDGKAPVARRFTTNDPVVRDHVIGGVPVLHASIFLEMARLAAGRQQDGAAVRALRDVAWEQTVRVAAEGASIRIDVALEADGVACTMVFDGGIAARGRAVFGPAAVHSRIDIDVVKQATDRHVARAEIEALDRGAVRLGPSFAGFDELWLGKDAALSWAMPSAADTGFVLPPRLMDAAIQTGAALLAHDDGPSLRLRYPAGIEAIEIVGPAPTEGTFILARRTGRDSVDIVLADRQGLPWLVWTAFEMRAAAAPVAAVSDPVPARTCRITWQASDVQRGAIVAPDAIVGDGALAALLAGEGRTVLQASAEDRPALEALVAGLGAGARIVFADPHAPTPLGLLRLVKLLAARGLGTTAIELRVLTVGANPVGGHDATIRPAAAALQGLAKAVGREFPAWRVEIVDVEGALPASALRDIVLGSPVPSDGEPIAWRRGAPFVRVLEPSPLSHVSQASHRRRDSVKRNGVYLLVGGMGRIGRELARHLARTFAARLVLIGRRPLDSARQEFLDELGSLGGEAEYRAGDATQPGALSAAVAAAEARFGAIDGVVQAAVEPLFERLDRTDEAAFAASLAPKMAGLVALAEATAHCRLDFFAVFSSIGAYAGFPGNVGQASYCAACCFEEAFAAQLEAAGRPVRLIQWGLWENEAFAGEGLRRLTRQGTYPMRTADALAAFERMLAGPDRHLVHASLSDKVWAAMGATPTPGEGFVQAEAALLNYGGGRTPVDDTLHDAVDAYARTLTAKLVRERGLPWQASESAARDALAARWSVLPRHRRLFEATLDLLQRVPATAPTRDELLARAPSVRDPLDLLETCVAALPDVIGGEREGTDVLFPGGSMHLVEAIYRNQPVLAACNAMLAGAAMAARPLRILEIGAGTGATADAVLAALPAGGPVEYHYTDISPGFVRHARQRRSADPRLRFAVLDIERDPAGQGVAADSIDLVVATNVLHATRDIGETLAHIAKVLRPGGLVLVNEMTVAEDFATLTFGLLDGWWRAADAGRRLPHSPLLDLGGWRRALRAAGFAHVTAAPAPGFADIAASPQVVILAAKAGQASVALPGAGRTASVPTAPDHERAGRPRSGKRSTPAMADVEVLVRARVAAGLDLAPEEIDLEAPFGEQGVDSIVAPQIAEDIAKAAGVALRPTDLYNFATVRTLAAHVASLQPVLAAEEPPVFETAPLPAVPANAYAIVGMAGRFPDAPDLERFWENIAAGRSAVREIERFDISPWYAPERGKPGKTYAKWAAVLEDYDRFDPLFFSISPAEAEAMDPQQRLLLEEAWHALEDAGITPRQLDGRRCGVFVGASANSYMAPASPSLQTLGGSMAILSARLSYFLNLKGPTFPVDTGCSSSLVALHLACQSLRLGESDMAIAGGVSCNLLSPPIFTYLSDAGMASPQGRCNTFDDSADGFAPGEGVGVVVLKRLSDALRDGDRIHAVVRGTGINQDGKTSGLTAPSATSQTELECEVYRQADVDPATIGLVEAHGTGTKLGDPIEVAALTDAFAAFTPAKQFCAIGSVKTNIGHAMAAAGVAGLLKAVQAVRHRTLPPSLNFTVPNRHIDFANSPFVVNTVNRPWESEHPRRAVVSSFGFSGTNAHILIEQAPEATSATSAIEPGPYLFVVSGKTEAALARRIDGLRGWLAAHPEIAAADLAYTLAARRAHFRFRRAFVAGSLAELGTLLAGLAPASVAVFALDDLAKRYSAGEDVDFTGLRGRLVDLPGYPFERERFWNPQGVSAPVEDRMLGDIVDSWVTRDHVVQGRRLLPGAAFLELVRATVHGATAACSIRDVVWSAPVDATHGAPGLSLDTEAAGEATRCALRAGSTIHASGLVGPALGPKPSIVELSRIVAACPTRLDGAAIYEAAQAHGFAYGSAFRVIDKVAIGQSEAVADLRAPATGGDWVLHPALLDGALQTAACIGLGRQGTQPTFVPFALDALDVFAPLGGACRVHARLTRESATLLVFDVAVCAMDGTVLAMLHGLQARALTPAASTEAETLLFAPEWRKAGTPAVVDAVVFALADDAACRQLRARRLVRVEPGLAFVRHSADHFTIDPASENDYRRLLTEAAPGAGAVLVHLWSMGASAEPATLSAALDASLSDAGLRSFFLAVRAALQVPEAGVVRAIYATPAVTEGAAAAAFARTVGLESSRLSCGAVTLEAGDLKYLPAEFAAPREDEEVEYRNGARYLRTLREVSATGQVPTSAAATPVYVITGGAGAIGLRIALHLARKKPCRLVLIGRSPQPARPEALEEIEAAGADVLYLQADVTSGAALRSALDKARRRYGPINGIFHAAGLLRDVRIAQMRAEAFDAVVAPKIAGAIVLDWLTREDPLEAFVLFSSTAAVFGSAGQAAYAGANGFLDGFAEARRARGGRGRTVSIAWPLWQSSGMAPPPEVAAELERKMGMRAMPEAAAFAALDDALALNAARLVVLHGRSDTLRRFVGGTAVVGQPVPTSSPVAADLRDTVERYLKEIIAEVTKLAPGRIDSTERFEAYGIDSMMIVRMNARLEEDLGELPKTLFFEYQTVRDLADCLMEAHPGVLARRFGGPRASSAFMRPRAEDARNPHENAVREASDDDAIAIIGISGLYPQANDLGQFWRNLAAGRDCIVEIPPERWALEGFYDPDRERPETSYSKWGGFIDGVDHFDARFFNISPREADALDPQARKFLEVAWATMEDAGLTRDTLFRGDPDPAQRQAGVFVGVMYGDYQLFGPEEAARGNLIAPNAAYWNVANRVSHFLDLHGPSMAIDTACSSSLTAIHTACAALRNGDCTVAFAGGVNLTVHPGKHWILSKSGFASSDGRCRSFGAGGDGYVPGEGIGAVLLKTLARARADGDRIHAVIRSSAVNHGGRTSGYTVPNPVAQGSLVAAALARKGIAADSISYVEAHGTGTSLGDPVEIAGLSRAFKGVAPQSLPVGSIKSNIGHLESAAGIAALTKVVLQLGHEMLVPSLHADTLNPNLDLATTPFYVQRERTPWPRSPERVRRAGISSFGAGGANAHLVVEEAPEAGVEVPHDGSALIVPFSAATAERLVDQATRLAAWLTGDGAGIDFASIVRTLQVGREAMRFRAAFLARNSAELAVKLTAFAGGQGARPVPDAVSWVDGSQLNWDQLAPGPRRAVSLPTYAFAPRRCWVELTEAKPAVTGPLPIACDPADPLVAQHRFGGETVLAGAFLLEAARRAGSRVLAATVTGASDVRFLRRTTPEMKPFVAVESDGSFTVRSGEQVHVSGRLQTDEIEPLPELDIAALRLRCPERIEHAAIYAALATGGAQYGEAYRLIRRIARGDGEVLADLAPSDERAGWPPAVLDAAFQITFALVAEQGGAMPFTLDRLTVHGPLSRAAHVHGVRREAGPGYLRLDLRVIDGDGTVLAGIDGFVARTAAQAVAAPALPLRLLAPLWRASPRQEAALRGRTLVLAEDTASRAIAGDIGEIVAALPATMTADHLWIVMAPEPGDSEIESVTRLAGKIRALAALPEAPKVTILTAGANAVRDGETANPAAAAIAAFAKSAGREHPEFKMRVIDLEPGTRAADVSHLPHHEGEVAWRSGSAWIKRYGPVSLPADAPMRWRRGGVYLIAGGAGGIGLALAEHLVKVADARVVLLGRRVPDSALTAKLSSLGEGVVYIEADVTDASAVYAAVAQVKARFGTLAGAFHLALAMHDARAVTLTGAQISSVLAPKIEGTRNLMTALRDEPLDAFVIFSSSNAHTANPGQSAYAAASAAQDAIGLAPAPWRVKVIDWGFWGEVGRVAAPQFHASLARLGVYPIGTAEGFATVERLLASPFSQLVPLRISDAVADALGVETTGTLDEIAAAIAPRVTAGAAMLADAADSFGSIDDYAATLLLLAFRELGALQQPGDIIDLPQLATLGVEPRFARLSAAALDMLNRAGFIDAAGDRWVATQAVALETDALRRTLAARRTRWIADQAEVSPYLDLLDIGGGRIAEVLRGTVDANDVLFPGGSAHLVEPIYRGNQVVDHFQSIVAESTVAAVRARLASLPAGETLQILEVGAGTGGTSVFVLEALAPYADRIRYHFTDVGKFFLDAARPRFAKYPFVEFELLDIERPPARQGFMANGFDVVIAANVLHATRDIDATLGNVRALCSAGGVLLINEATARQDFNTMTFGLTRGWWLFEDAGRRIPHAPLLGASSWLDALAAQGFRGARVLAGGEGALQSVIAAEGDGITAEAARPAAASPAPASDGGKLAETLRRTVAKALRLGAEEVELETSFADYGADSIISVDLVREINAALGIELKTTALFNYSTVSTLAAYIRTEFAAQLGVAAEDSPKPASRLKERSERLRGIIRKRREGMTDDASLTPTPSVSPVRTVRATDTDDVALFDLLQRLEAKQIGVAEAMIETGK